MAYFEKRGQFQWRAQVRRKGYPTLSKTCDTKAEAEAWANMIESEMSRGVWVSRVEAESTTLAELLGRYEREIVPGKKGKAQELSVLNIWRGTDVARRTVAGVRGADVAELRDEWLKEFKPATVLRRLSVLSHVFNVARREWRMESVVNPVELVRKPSFNNARTRRVELRAKVKGKAAQSEVDFVIAATGSSTLPAVITLAVETAMRRSEIAGLCWEHIDLKRRVAHLPATKNGDARDVPLSSKATAALATLFPSKVKAKPVKPMHGPVFSLRADAITRAFERAVARARRRYEEACEESGKEVEPLFLVDLRFHDLRHEATSRLAVIYQLHELAKVTGHKDPRMLLRYYHPRAEDLAKRLG